MRFYPAYKLQEVLAEYAVVFYALLNEAYRLQHQEYSILGHIADLPHMKSEDRKKFYQQLEWAATHPDDILSSSGEGSDPADIKKLLGG